MDHLDKELEQLITDPSFQKFALNQDEAAKQHWENWMDANPGMVPLLQRAKAIVQMLHTSRQDLPPESVEVHWKALENHLFVSDLSRPHNRKWYLPKTWHFFLAAAVIGAIFLAFGLWPNMTSKFGSQKHVLTTNYGEKQSLQLPDGSQIVLNANSELTYYTPWDSAHPREVWLNGEGFFDIVHAPKIGGKQFRVHLNDMTVDVLGTSFNVNSRHNRMQVVLKEGKVRLTHKEKADTLTMIKGEMVEFAENELFIRRKVDPDRYTSWIENRILFEESSLQSIGEMIIDRYGLNVEIIGSNAFAKRTFSGEAIVENIDDFILLLETFEIVVIQEEDRLLLRENTH